MKGREFKRIWGPNYDYYYLLKLEQRKLKEMVRDFTKWKHHTDWDLSVREMNICIQLIDIILEQDKYYKSWLHTSFGTVPYEVQKFPIHVNIRNYERFFKKRGFFLPQEGTFRYNHLIPEVRRRKALHLYNKIRASRMFGWWD